MQFCSNCDSSRSEYSCLDCPVLERNFCAICCDLHTKVKSTKAHRLILSGPKIQIVTETTNKVIIKTHTNDSHDKKLSSVDLTSVQASCLSRSFCPCKNFSSGDIISKIGHTAYKVRSVFTALVDTTDFFALLAFFEIDTVLERFPLAYALIPTICLLALVMMFSSELITKNGSSIAVIVGAIAFLQRSRWSSGSTENKSATNAIHANRRKKSLSVTSAHPVDRVQNSNLLTSGSLHAHNDRRKVKFTIALTVFTIPFWILCSYHLLYAVQVAYFIPFYIELIQS